ncbi:MAG: hypothetical protein GZ090_02660 [Oxalobacteraceae bacterium]|nr:hypothetical protein [Oxalobacteraceae bacterium]
MPPSELAATLVADPAPVQPIPKPKSRRKPRTSVADTETGIAPVETQAEPVVVQAKPRKRVASKPQVALASELDVPSIVHVIDSPALAPVSLAQAVLSRVLGAGRYAPLPQFGADGRLALQSSDLPVIDADPYRALVMHGPAGGIEFGDGVRLLMALTGIDLGESAVDIPESQWLTASVLGRLAGTPLRDITSLSRGCLAPGPDDITLCLSLRGGLHAFSIMAKASAAVWLDFLSRTGWQHSGRVIEHQLDLPLTFQWRIGSHTLDRSVIDGLVAGDIVLPDTCWFDCSGTGRIRIGSWQLSVVYTAPAGMTLLSLETRMDSLGTIVDTDSLVVSPSLAGTHDAGGLDTLPLQLHFDMGCCHTTLGGLRTLVAGSVLPIEGGSPAAIGITAGGRTLGQGELVEVNGKLAIRIIHWS